MSTQWTTPAPPRPGTPRWAIALVAVVAVLVTATGVLIALTVFGGTASATEVTREPVNTAGSNPFMPPIGKDVEKVAAPKGAGGQFSGNTPGLYGGTKDNRTCDAKKLTSFLDSHPGQAAAWAGVLGIKVTEIDSYVTTLTPVLLRSDTRVTNHGYTNGRATVISSVLQAGSAVFVDKYGSPVVRCACGNPLTAPTLLNGPTYVGPTWVTFNQTNITIVQNTTVIINNYTLIDPRERRVFDRPAGDRPTSDDGDYTGPPLDIPTEPGTPTSESSTSSTSSTSDSPTSDSTTAGSPTSDSTTSSASGDPTQRSTCPDGSAAAVVATATGDLTGDGRPDAVVLGTCGGEQQVQAIDSTGTALGTLPALQAPENSPFPPTFDGTLSLSGTTLTTGVNVFGATDTESTGPTGHQSWTWNWTGSSFTLDPSSVTAVTPAPTTTDDTTTPSTLSGPTSDSTTPDSSTPDSSTPDTSTTGSGT